MVKLIKKHMTRPFLKDGENWVQIKKAIEFVRSMNAETEDRNYIADEFATTEVLGYKPSIPLSITTLQGEPDFDLFYKFYKTRAIGDDAKRDMLLVYLFETGLDDGETVYYAEKTNVTVTVNELNTSGSSLSITVSENGTPTVGYVSFDASGKPTFTEGELPTA